MNARSHRPEELKVAYWPLDRLVPYARNARTHSAEQVAEIAGSIRAFGFVNPLLVGEDGDIIAGHGRLGAARLLQLTEVPVIVLEGLSEVQRRQLVLADNRIAMNAGWDMEMLKLELADLLALGADLKPLGFSDEELAAALSPATGGLTDEDDAPPLQETPVSRLGDIWCLGQHRVGCGDSTDASAVAALLGSVKPMLMVTDPPYGVDYDPTRRGGVSASSKKRRKILNDDRADWRSAWALFPGNIAYVWHAALNSIAFAESLTAQGFVIRAQIIWAKERLVMSRGDYHWQHEPCWYAVRNKGQWTGDRKQTTLWTIPSGGQDAETVHSTQKPVECMRRPIVNNSNPGQAVYEPFLGSGTTLIAAETVGRVCFGMELDPLFVDVAVRRWQAFTGREAKLQGGGSFEIVASERLSPPGSSSSPSARRAPRAKRTTDHSPAPSAEAPG